MTARTFPHYSPHRYLALDLQLDWRAGADHFESLLVWTAGTFT